MLHAGQDAYMTWRTGIVFSPVCLLHKAGEYHPESPARLRLIMRGIEDSNLLENERIALIEPRAASLHDLRMAHSVQYIKMIRDICKCGGGLLDEETGTAISQGSFLAASFAAGGAIRAVEFVMKGRLKNAFVLCRPPGHHAGYAYADGFCIFNNVALAAKYLINEFSLDGILIFDIDAHHGNGTQEIFYDTDEVLYISLHEDPSEFPGTGFVNEIGDGRGTGYTVNIPFPYGTSDHAYWRAIKSIVTPIIEQYEPRFILISAGFDGYFRDFIGELSLSAYIYPSIFQIMLDLAHKFSGDRLVAILEGGYRLGFLKKIIPAVISRMAGLEFNLRDDRPKIDLTAQRSAEKIVEEAREIQSRFWNL